MLRASSLILIAAFSSAVALCSCGGTIEGAAQGTGGSTAGSSKKSDGSAAGGTTGTGGGTIFHEPGAGSGGVGGAAGSNSGGSAGGNTAQGSGGVAGTGGRSTSSTGGRASGGGAGSNPDAGALGGSAAGAGGSGARTGDASATDGRSPGGVGGAVARNGGASGTGGRRSPDASGAPDAGVPGADGRPGGAGGAANPGTGGSGTGGGPVGTGGNSANAPKILWTDTVQTAAAPWGLDGWGTEHPVGTTVTPNDANGANFSVVADPLGGTGRAIRHFATFDTGGSRSQAGIYSDVNTVFGKQAKSAEGVWVAQEWYFPSAIDAKGETYCWISVWDFHSVDGSRGNRWHTSPGLMLAQDGSMRVQFQWGGPAANINANSKYSSVAMPVGRWFDIEMHYVWADSPSATLTVWIDGQLALEESGVQTRDPGHQIVETYLKFYGSTQGHGAWSPTPSLKYTRNVRVAGERIWR